MSAPTRWWRPSFAWPIAYVVLVASAIGMAALDEGSVLATAVLSIGTAAMGFLVGLYFAEIRNGRSFGTGSYSLGVVVIMLGLLYSPRSDGWVFPVVCVMGFALFVVELAFRLRRNFGWSRKKEKP